MIQEQTGTPHRRPESGLKIVDISDIAEQEAEDRAEKTLHEAPRRNLGVTRLERFTEGVKNIGHNIALGLTKYYRRNKELREVRAHIGATGNIYAGRGSLSADAADNGQALHAILDRFDAAHAPEDILQKDEHLHHMRAGEALNTETAQFKSHLFDLIGAYAANRTMTIEEFTTQKKELYDNFFHGTNSARTVAVSVYADNALEMAEAARSGMIHIDSLREVEKNTALTIGKARTKYKTRADFNIVDRGIDALQHSQITSWISPEILSAGVATAFGILNTGRGFAMKGVNAATFGLAGAAVTGSMRGFTENQRLKAERGTVTRSMARGETFATDAERRAELAQFVLGMRSAGDLIGEFRRNFCGADTNLRHLSEAETSGAIRSLAEIEARISFRDLHSVDTISYLDGESETLHTELMLLRATMKTQLSRSLNITSAQLRERLDREAEQFLTTMATEKNEKDALERSFRIRRSIRAGLKGGAIGLGLGLGIQEVTAFFNDNVEGLAEHFVYSSAHGQGAQTSLHAFAAWAHEKTGFGIPSHALGMLQPTHVDLVAIPGGGSIHVNLPTDYSLLDRGNGAAELALPDGRHLALMIDPTTGNFDSASLAFLSHAGLHDINGLSSVGTTTTTETHTETGHEYIQRHATGPNWYTRPHGMQDWYGNNTASKAEFNELRAWYQGEHHSGFTQNGDAQLRIDMKEYAANSSGHQTAGSLHHALIGRPGKALTENRLFWELTPEKGGPTFRVPFHHNGDGTVTAEVPHDNPALRMIFGQNTNGHIVEKAFLSEIIEEVHDKNGIVKGFHTYASQNFGGHHLGDVRVTDITTKSVPNIDTTITVLGDNGPDVVPFIPVYWGARQELEQAAVMQPLMYGYGYEGTRRNHAEQGNEKNVDSSVSETLKHDPNVRLDEHKEITSYLAHQTPEHTKRIEALAGQIKEPMAAGVRTVVAIPVAGHQEGKNIYETLENFTTQTADPSTFEIVLFVNHPMTDEKGKPVTPDATIREITRFKKNHPKLAVRVMYSPLPIEQAKIGLVRKLLNDAVILRQAQRGASAPELIIVSNDADNKGVSQHYIQNFVDMLDKHPEKDGYLGNLDWDPAALVKYPELYIGTRLFQYLNAINRKLHGKTISSGGNFAFRSSIYAAVGGYHDDSELGEDIAFGTAISNARGTNKTIAYTNRSLLFTSARRSIEALRHGHSPLEQWDKIRFSAFDELRREGSVRLDKPVNFASIPYRAELKKRIELMINKILNNYISWEKIGKDAPKYKKVLAALGIQYKLDSKGEVEITDMGLLIQKLKEFQEVALLYRDSKMGLPGKLDELKTIKRKRAKKAEKLAKK